ncbi:MAG TPA: NAD(P)/FAD-dependent oxidoreductase [Dermatophilaceae bacterium]|nr:NAD(P)/FAD-dependent oxidoreductase [Dermatophilaceae bacterium]
MTRLPSSGRPAVDYEVVIVGAGFSGIGQAIALKRAGQHDFVLLEKSSGVGGTWRENTYPGVSCDAPSQLYSYSFEPDPGWTRTFAPGQALHDYLQRCVAKYYVEPHLRLDTILLAANFAERSATWELTVATGDGRSSQLRCRSLVLALGPLHVPANPDIPGLLDFSGPLLHTAAWDRAVSLRGRRVGVVGTGTSAVQLVPAIVEEVAELTVFQRTAPWVLPRRNAPLGPLHRRLLERFPALMRWRRWRALRLAEALAPAFTRQAWQLGLLRRRALGHLRSQVHDPSLRAALTPTDVIGCRRVVRSSDYLPVFGRPHVRLDTAPIRRVTGSGVVTGSGHTGLDVLVLATGFIPGGSYLLADVTGLGGRVLGREWANEATAYYGVMVAGFPNLFTLLGPNSGLGHTAVLPVAEAQARFIVSAISERDRRGAVSVQVRPAAQERFNAAVRRSSARSVWLTGCSSWYLDRDGANRAIWPWSVRRYEQRTATLHTDDLWFVWLG